MYSPHCLQGHSAYIRECRATLRALQQQLILQQQSWSKTFTMWLQLGVLLLGLSVLGPVRAQTEKFIPPTELTFYFKWHDDPPSHQEKACSYYGYIPGGEKVNISPIPPIEVQAGEDTLNDAAGTVGHISTYGNSIMTIAGGMVDAGSKAATACPVAAGIFGLVGLVSGIWSGNRAPDPLDVMQEALDELTDYINDRLEDVVNYVDQAILEAQIDHVDRLLQECQLQWQGCLAKSIDRREGLDCQQNVEITIAAMRPHFMQYERQMSPKIDNHGNIIPVPHVVPDGTWDTTINNTLISRQFCEEIYPGLCPLYSDVRLMEGTAASFTQYATLHMYLLISIYGDYVNSTDSEVNNRWEHMRVYLEEIVHMGALYEQYADWIQSWAEQRNIWENWLCYADENPFFEYPSEGTCHLYPINECDADGWQDIMHTPSWKVKAENIIDYLMCKTHYNNMLPDNECSQTLEVRVDGKGETWMSNNPDTVWSAIHPTLDNHEAGLMEHQYQFHDRTLNLWQYSETPLSDLRNWWEANVRVEASQWLLLSMTALDTYNHYFAETSTSSIQVDKAVYQQLKAELAASRQFK